jgi:hypothetical protein
VTLAVHTFIKHAFGNMGLISCTTVLLVRSWWTRAAFAHLAHRPVVVQSGQAGDVLSRDGGGVLTQDQGVGVGCRHTARHSARMAGRSMRLQGGLCWYHVRGMLLVELVLLQDKLCWACCMLLFAAHAQA